MKIIVRERTYSGEKCRFCKARCRWELHRPERPSWQTPDRLCDRHLSNSLRNLGLSALTIEHTATVTAVIRP